MAGEEVHTKVAVLARLRRHGDTDDLAGTALEDQEVTNADEVAGNVDGVRGMATAGADNPYGFTDAIVHMARATLVHDNAVPVVVMAVVAEGVSEAVRSTLHTTAERVVVAFVVVVTHFVSWGVFENGTAVCFDVYLGTGLVWSFVFDVANVGRRSSGVDRGVLAVERDVDFTRLFVTGLVLELVVGIGASTVFTLSDIDLSLVGPSVLAFVVSIPGEIYFGVAVTGMLFVDGGFLEAGTGATVAVRLETDVDVDLFTTVVCSGWWERAFVSSIFPSDARSTC